MFLEVGRGGEREEVLAKGERGKIEVRRVRSKDEEEGKAKGEKRVRG